MVLRKTCWKTYHPNITFDQGSANYSSQTKLGLPPVSEWSAS